MNERCLRTAPILFLATSSPAARPPPRGRCSTGGVVTRTHILGSMVLPRLCFGLAAVLAAAQASMNNPADAEMPAVFDRAVELMKAGKLAEAIPEYERFVALQPGNVEARSNIGAAFAAQGRYAEDIEQYQQALRMAEGNAQVRLNL